MNLIEKFQTKISGVTFPNQDGQRRQDIIKRCRNGDKIFLELDKDSNFTNAIKVIRKNKEQLGYIPREINQKVSSYFNNNYNIEANIISLTGGTDKYPTRGCNIEIRIYEKGNPLFNKKGSYFVDKISDKSEIGYGNSSFPNKRKKIIVLIVILLVIILALSITIPILTKNLKQNFSSNIAQSSILLIDWDEAFEHIDEYVGVKGPVKSAKFFSNESDDTKILYLNIGRDLDTNNNNRFVVVINEKYFNEIANSDAEIIKYFENNEVKVYGKIILNKNDNIPRIYLDKWENIEISK